MAKTKEEEKEKDHPEGGYGWLTVAGCFIVTFICKGNAGSLGVLFVEFREYYQTEAGLTSWVPSTYGALSVGLAPVASAFSKRFGARSVVMIGGISVFLSLMLGSFTTEIWQLTLTVGVLHGAASGLAYSPSVAYIGYYFKKRHSLATGLGFVGSGVGSFTLPLLLRLCLNWYGLRGTMWIYAALSAHLCVTAAILRPVDFKSRSAKPCRGEEPLELLDHEQKTSLESSSGENTSKELISLKRRTCHRLKDRICGLCRKMNEFLDCSRLLSICLFDLFLFILFVASFALMIVLIFLAPLMNEAGMSKEQAAILVSLCGVGNMVSGPVLGIMTSHFQWHPVKFVSLMFVFFGLTSVLTPFAQTFATAAVFAVSLGVGRGGFGAQISVCARRVVGETMFVTGYGWTLLAAGIGALIGPLISGYLRDFTGTYAYSFYLSGVCMILSGIALFVSLVVVGRSPKSAPVKDIDAYEVMVVDEVVSTV